jgi:hypothetical protein
MNPNTAPEAQFVGQPAPEVPPQPSFAGIPSAESPQQPFTITGPAQPIRQEAPAVAAPPPIPEEFIQHSAPPVPEAQFAQAPTTPPEATYVQPTVQPGPEAVPPPPPMAETPVQTSAIPNNPPAAEYQPQQQPYPSVETQTATQAMTPNLGPDVASATQVAEAEAAMAIPHAPLNRFPDVVAGIDQTTEKSEAESPATEKRMTDSLMIAQRAWETAGKNTDPEYTKAARAAIQGALEKDLTAIMGREWNAPEPEEAWK